MTKQTTLQLLPTTPHTRMKTHDRDHAVKLNRIQNRREPHKHYIGITSHSHIFLDIDAPYPHDAIIVAKWLCLIIRDEAGVFSSGRHFWVVSKHGVDTRVWDSIYESALDTWSQQGLDIMHATLSRRYQKSTLRITRKHPEDRIRLIYRVFPDGFVMPHIKGMVKT